MFSSFVNTLFGSRQPVEKKDPLVKAIGKIVDDKCFAGKEMEIVRDIIRDRRGARSMMGEHNFDLNIQIGSCDNSINKEAAEKLEADVLESFPHFKYPAGFKPVAPTQSTAFRR